MTRRPFRLIVKDDGVFIAMESGADASLADVLAYIRLRQIDAFDGDRVARAVAEKSTDPVRIADRKPDFDRPALVEIKISEDALLAEIRVTRPLGKPWPNEADFTTELSRKGVVFGINEAALIKMAREHTEDQWVEVARGVPPIDGKDAEFLYKVDLHGARPKQVDDDHVDMKNLGTVINVVQGQELLEKKPAVPSTDGTSVLGKIIKARPAKDKPIPAGQNTTLSEDGFKIFSNIDGCIKLKDGKIAVLPVFEVAGDVDYSTGNLQFVGDVVVKGTVREGFEITAGGNVTVMGVIEGALITCEGDLTVRGGVRGMGKAKLQVKGDILAGYLDQVTARAGKNVRVSEAIMHSDVGAREGVYVLGGKKGIVVGGRVQAGNEILCEVLGNEMGTKTEAVVGVPPEIMEERTSLQHSVKETETKLAEIVTNVDFLKKLEAAGKLDDAKRQMMLKLTRAQFQLQAQQKVGKEKLEELDSLVERNRHEGRVGAKKAVYSGVSISIRGLTYLVRDSLAFVMFSYIDGEIKVRSYS